ncbi:MAG: asparaginase [Chloroflexi bacterium]|nr:MAG: asparaginase [Chloroflexota bacterium]MBL1194569.1 asparaginase [Chloroflexota bacterium]NOH11858.1 asparaginase [Chloroflexota bacterium]
MPNTAYEPVFELTRGDTPESQHYGVVAVVNAQGELVASVGDPDMVTFTRSTAKPFQALPFIEAGGHKHFGFSQKEIALICASHSGTSAHVRAVQKLHRKVGLDKDMLQCGVHYPYHAKSAHKMRAKGKTPRVYHHNCSGKHSGMLAFAKFQDWPLESYLEIEHPVQQAILKSFASMCDLDPNNVPIGIDGCSAPNFAAPLQKVALGYARLADPAALPDSRAEACRTVFSAMTSRPKMVAGPKRLDTRLMQVTKGRVLIKQGAEGYLGMALLPDAIEPGSPALGIAMKISDGDPRSRARRAVAVEILRQLHALSDKELDALGKMGPSIDVLNWRKRVVGEGRTVFQLN